MSQPIASIQAALSALGYAPGPADGLFGPRTSAAVSAWLAAGGAPARKPDADKPELYQGATPVREIIIHCSATPPGWMAGRSAADKVAAIRRWHIEDRGWSDIGYHWVIDRDGTLVRGRPETVVGAHTQGHNTGSIGICLDSAQHFIPNGGCCYQNVVSGGHIGGVAVGVYLGCKSRIVFSSLAASLT